MTRDRGRGHDPRKKVSISQRASKVTIADFATIPADFTWYKNLRGMIPNILRGREIEELSARLIQARERERAVIIMLGAHVVKCGLSGLLCDLMRRHLVTWIAMNGACAIHDLEIAMWGKTSEDVAAGLEGGYFGMTEETAHLFNDAAGLCLQEDIGLGEALGRRLRDARPPNQEVSLIATTLDLGIPLSVHVALGTDVVHQHDEADGRAIGFGTMKDFRAFACAIGSLNGGVVLNIGSAVMMPEVFLKALAIARNKGADLGEFTTANFDMFSHYRPTTSIVERPRLIGGTTYAFLGHHEILLPVFVASILSRATG